MPLKIYMHGNQEQCISVTSTCSIELWLCTLHMPSYVLSKGMKLHGKLMGLNSLTVGKQVHSTFQFIPKQTKLLQESDTIYLLPEHAEWYYYRLFIASVQALSVWH